MPVYRYKLAGIDINKVKKQVPPADAASVSSGSSGALVVWDVTAPTTSKDDIDDYLLTKGWTYVEQDPSDTPQEASDAEIIAAAPEAHDLAGSLHNTDTLADLNTKISDATLDTNTASRPPSGSAGGDLTGSTYPNPTVAASAITNAKLANMAQATVKGRASGAGTGAPQDLTPAQATAILDQFTAGLKGLVPASGGGTTNFLRADGSFTAPPGGSSFPSQMFQADQMESPVSSNWAVNALAPLIPDASNTALSVRAFDDSSEEGIGFTVKVPAGATNMILGFLGRAATAPGTGPDTVALNFYSRAVPDNAAIPSWSTETSLTDISIPTNAYYQKDSQTIAISTLGLTAGVTYTIEITRDFDDGDDLSGDWLLHSLTVDWS